MKKASSLQIARLAGGQINVGNLYSNGTVIMQPNGPVSITLPGGGNVSVGSGGVAVLT